MEQSVGTFEPAWTHNKACSYLRQRATFSYKMSSSQAKHAATPIGPYAYIYSLFLTNEGSHM